MEATRPSPAPGARLRELLRGPEPLVVPGAYDALSARLAAHAGAKAVYMTGFGVSGSLLGLPDIGLLSATEMADRARALADACAPVPLIADGDDGHGSIANAVRLARDYERAGVACIQIEDQVFPKRCGHMENKALVTPESAAAKIRAICEARASRDFLVMARTDARAVEGLEAALERAAAYREAGANLLFVEAPRSVDELRTIAARFPGVPLVANLVEGGKTPYLGVAELAALGYAIALYPISALLCVARRLQSVYATLLSTGRGLAPDAERLDFAEYNRLVGLDTLLADAARATGAPAREDAKRSA